MFECGKCNNKFLIFNIAIYKISSEMNKRTVSKIEQTHKSRDFKTLHSVKLK